MAEVGPLTQGVDRILQRAASGDEQAWARLVKLYGRRVFGLLLKQCGDRDLAEEITQATFVKLVEKLDQFKGYEERGRFEPWLFRIAMNRLRDEMRRRSRQAQPMDMSQDSATAHADAGSGADQAGAWARQQQRIVMGGPTPGEDPLDALDRAEQIEMMLEAVKTLSPADQEILYLRHTAGLSFAQIAETLDEPLGTVLARGHRALIKLRKILGDTEGDQESTTGSSGQTGAS